MNAAVMAPSVSLTLVGITLPQIFEVFIAMQFYVNGAIFVKMQNLLFFLSSVYLRSYCVICERGWYRHSV